MKRFSLSLSVLILTPLLSIAENTISGIGSVTDPSGDSKITGDAALLAIAIPPGDHTLDRERSNMTAPRILQAVTGDFTAEVTISGNYLQNTSTQVGGRRPFQAAGLLVMVSPETYIRLERAQVKITNQNEIQHISYPSWEARFEGKQLRWGSGNDGIIATPTSRLRLTRTGNHLIAAISDDGSTWRELDPITIKLPETVQIGVSASHNTTSSFEGKFANYVLTPLAKTDK